MSFIITMYVREGIVMASDSRITLNRTTHEADKSIVKLAVAGSDSNYKTFLAHDRIGVSTYGAADIKGVPIAGYIESFIAEKTSPETTVKDFAEGLLAHFGSFDPSPGAQFHVAGYQSESAILDQQVYHVHIADGSVRRVNQSAVPGASWGGEADILSRLIQPVAELDEQGAIKTKLPHEQIPWQFFTLQDAIDFCVFAVRSTIDAMRFFPRPKTVGGPIDVLVLKPSSALWVQRKTLKVQ